MELPQVATVKKMMHDCLAEETATKKAFEQAKRTEQVQLN